MINKIIEELKNEPSTNRKLDILKYYENNSLFKKVLYYTYNPLIKFYTKHQIDEKIEFNDVEPPKNLNTIFPILDSLNRRKLSGHDAINALDELGTHLHEYDIRVLNKILDKDLDCGISIKSINKVFKNFIPTVSYNRCSLPNKHLKNIQYPAIIQTKMDGIFCNIAKTNGVIKFYTRKGIEFDAPFLKSIINNIFKNEDNIVLHGELLVRDFNDSEKILYRKIGNGLINSFIKRESTIQRKEDEVKNRVDSGKDVSKYIKKIEEDIKEFEKIDSHLLFVAWDKISYYVWTGVKSCNTDYINRFNSIRSNFIFSESNFVDSAFDIVEYSIVNSYEEAIQFYNKMIDNGEEGAVLKNFKMRYKDGTSTEQIKLKSEKECELIVNGFNYGERNSEFENGIGSLICSSSDGKINVNVGSGLTRSDRGFERVDKYDSSKGIKLIDGFNLNKYSGKIITVRFNELIRDEKGNYSLFLPRFIEIREDKDIADDLNYIKNL